MLEHLSCTVHTLLQPPKSRPSRCAPNRLPLPPTASYPTPSRCTYNRPPLFPASPRPPLSAPSTPPSPQHPYTTPFPLPPPPSPAAPHPPPCTLPGRPCPPQPHTCVAVRRRAGSRVSMRRTRSFAAGEMCGQGSLFRSRGQVTICSNSCERPVAWPGRWERERIRQQVRGLWVLASGFKQVYSHTC